MIDHVKIIKRLDELQSTQGHELLGIAQKLVDETKRLDKIIGILAAELCCAQIKVSRHAEKLLEELSPPIQLEEQRTHELRHHGN